MAESFFDDDEIDLQLNKYQSFWLPIDQNSISLQNIQPQIYDQFYIKQQDQIVPCTVYLDNCTLYRSDINRQLFEYYQEIYVAKLKWFDENKIEIENNNEIKGQHEEDDEEEKKPNQNGKSNQNNKHEYWFQLTKNRQSCQFFTKDMQIIEKWRNFLNLKALQSNFHEDFAVTKMIGKGTFAKVYLATKKQNQQQYAIKAFNKQYMLTQHKGKLSLINEIIIMRNLDSDFTIRLYDVYETMNSIYFVLDLLQGGELINKVKYDAQNFMESDLKLAMMNLMFSLKHIHSRQIMHRDIKPENILLKTSDSYNLMMADFGLATYKDNPAMLFKRCGTPGYVAPEILQYKDGMAMYDERCDIFSAGIIFFVLLTGKHPFTGIDYKEILKANKICQIDYSQYKIENIEALNLLQAMLKQNPEQRPTAEEVLNHAYLQQKESNTDMAIENYTLDEQINKFRQGIQNKVMDSEENLQGSMTLKNYSQTAMNGKIDSFSVQVDSNQSIDLKETGSKYQKQIYSKFKNDTQNDSGGEQDLQMNKKSKQSQNLHQKAIRNSLKQQFQTSSYSTNINQNNSPSTANSNSKFLGNEQSKYFFGISQQSQQSSSQQPQEKINKQNISIEEDSNQNI